VYVSGEEVMLPAASRTTSVKVLAPSTSVTAKLKFGPWV
jgi:hypothetical protein